jgi:glycosyltransferase involved in cell wall biosynthesis
MRLARKWGKPTIFFSWQNIYKTYPPPFNLIERHSFNYAKAAIAGSQEALEILRSKGFTKPVSVIPQLGVDPDFFVKNDSSSLRSSMGIENKFVIGYVGRIVEEKGIGDMISALSKLPQLCALVLVGEGKFRGEAERLAQQLGLSSRIHWIPQVASLDIPRYMNLFDILVLPSRTTLRWKEQFGRVLVEAMACGTPPIGSSSGEIPNVIGDGGLVFPERDADALAAQIRLLLDHPDYLSTLAEKGRARVLQNFTHRKIAERTVQLYYGLLERFSPQNECIEQVIVPSYSLR